MPRLTGQALVIKWTPDGGTEVDLSGNRRSWEYNEKTKLVDITAGNDTHKKSAATIAIGTGKLEMLDESGATGVTLRSALAKGTSGTLEWAPEGTDTGAPKFTVSAIVEESNHKNPYDNAVEWQVNFEFQEDIVESTYA